MSATEALRRAALASAQALHERGTDPQSGRIGGDPLHALIPGDGQADAETLALVQQITGRTTHYRPPRGSAANTAPASRASLRRWAIHTRNGGI